MLLFFVSDGGQCKQFENFTKESANGEFFSGHKEEATSSIAADASDQSAAALNLCSQINSPSPSPFFNSTVQLMPLMSGNFCQESNRHNNAEQNGTFIQPLNAFLEQFFALDQSIERAQWEAALPSEWERKEMQKLILFLFQMDDFGPIANDLNGFLARIAPLLSKSVQLTLLDQNRFCAIHERFPPMGSVGSVAPLFPRFWGYAVLRSRAHCSRPSLHHSAPHFHSDGDVCNQAAAIFERTNSRSLVAAGASRFAVKGKWRAPCEPNNGAKNFLADAAHNNQTMFHTMCVALLEAARIEQKQQERMVAEKENRTPKNANGNDGIGTDSTAAAVAPAFLQWHGMAETSCVDSAGFLSIGASGTHPIYNDRNAIVNRLVSALNLLAHKQIARTPAMDSRCKLIAASNVFGRVVNGVPREECCRRAAKRENVHGQFIHIEQKRMLRDDWPLWTDALCATIPSQSDAK